MLEIVKRSSSKTAKPRKPRVTKTGPTPEQIEVRAYEIYIERGGAPGDPLQDWLQAESELQKKPRKVRRTKSKAA